MILNKVRFMVPTLLLCFVTFMLVGTADVFAQSTDENNPTPVTTDILNGEVGRTDERGTYYYVLEVRRSETIQADLSLTFTSGIAFSLSFSDAAGGSVGGEGDSVYQAVDNGGSGTETRTLRFTATVRQRVIMALSYAGRATYQIRIARSGGTDDTVTFVPQPAEVAPLKPCVDLAVQSLNVTARRSTSGKVTRLDVEGVVRNVSTVNFLSIGGLQSIQLWEKGLGGRFYMVKEVEFKRLDAGEEITITRQKVVTVVERRITPEYRLEIKYSPELRTNSSEEDDDCKDTNNMMMRSLPIK